MFTQQDVNEFLTNFTYGAFAAVVAGGLLCICILIVVAIRNAVRKSHPKKENTRKWQLRTWH
jgi:hypothetical protein